MSNSTTDVITTFGAMLRFLRRRARLTQQELGIAVGYSESYITRLESDTRAPVPSMVEARFVDALSLHDEPQLADRLIALAKAVHSTDSSHPRVAKVMPHTNLRPHLTRFIGRGRELMEVRRLVTSHRLVTLTGSGGVGKTRLSQEVAAGLLDHFADGVWLVELAPLNDPALVIRVLAMVLKLPNQMVTVSVDALSVHLASKHELLIFDNCEQVIQVCAELVEALLLACPQLSVLATSREALHVPGETTWRVPSLDSGESAGLFADRALAVRPEFAITSQNEAVLAAIGQRLDGIPLAIELAASRLSGMSLEQLAARLDNRFQLLSGGMRTALPRHQTLRALIDWSHNLLTDQERVLFRRLAVFAGGWTVEAAERVCASSGTDPHARADLYAPNVLPLLLNLAAKSLVLVEEHNGAMRYKMQETIREYALEQLAASNEVDATRSAHARFYLSWVQSSAPRVMRETNSPLQFVLGAESDVWAKQLLPDNDNLRAALAWCLQGAGERRIGIQLALWLTSFWSAFSSYLDAAEWLEAALTQLVDAADTRTRAQLLISLLEAANLTGRYQSAEAYGAEVLTLCRRTNQRFNLMRALQMCAGDLMHRRGDYLQAQGLVEEWLGIARELGDARYEGIAQFWLGVIAMYLRDFERALHHHHESLRVTPAEQVGTQRVAQFYQAMVWWLMGDDVRALAQCESSLAYFRETGFVIGSGTVLHTIGDIVLFRGDLEHARDSYVESLRMQYPLNTRQRMVWPLAGLAAFLADAGRPAQALTLWVATNMLRAAVGSLDHTMSHEGYVRRIDAARAALSAVESEAAERLGRTFSFDQTVTYGLAQCG